jgi:hypothetical protein
VRSIPQPVAQLLGRQHGLAATRQLHRLGVPSSLIRRQLDSGAWERVAPGVVGVVGHRESWHRSLWLGALHAGPDAVVSHESAAELHGFRQVERGRVRLIVPAGSGPAPDFAQWSRRSDLIPADTAMVHGLTVTGVARTVVDLAADLHAARLRLLLEDAIVRRRCTVESVGATLERVRRSGKRGVTKLDDVLDDLGPADGLPRSELERLADEAIRLAGLPEPVHEHPLPGRGVVTGFVDRAWPDALLILEADGRRWHERRQQMVRDADRNLEASRAGWHTIRLCWEHLAHDLAGTADTLRQIHAERRRLLMGPRHD